MLREYQQRTIDQLYAWFEAGNQGNPCLVLPTGSGKSHIVAALCKDALQNWPETRVLMLTHVKELIEQNAEKLRQRLRGHGFDNAVIRYDDSETPALYRVRIGPVANPAEYDAVAVTPHTEKYLGRLTMIPVLVPKEAGVVEAALQGSAEVRESVGLPDGHPHHFPMMVGYPKRKYTRLPERKAPKITWK